MRHFIGRIPERPSLVADILTDLIPEFVRDFEIHPVFRWNLEFAIGFLCRNIDPAGQAQ